jgi:hypothetical protein
MSDPIPTSPQDEMNSPELGDQPGREVDAAVPDPVNDDPLASSAAPVQGMIPGRSRRRTKLERASMRVLATGGIVGIGTALGAVLVSNDVAGWIVGLAVALTSVILAAVLWSSRQL